MPQVFTLKQRGIAACFLGTAQEDPSVAARAAAGEYLLVYLSPEKVDTGWMGIRQLVDADRLLCFAVDGTV